MFTDVRTDTMAGSPADALRSSVAAELHRGLLPLLPGQSMLSAVPAPSRVPGRRARIGAIHNLQARHNIARHSPVVIPGCEHAMPRSFAELHDVLNSFASSGIDALIIDGGDGTIRDVTSAAKEHFPGVFPRVAVVPSGKTNALALDLNIPGNWTAVDAVEAINRGHVEERAPLEIWRRGAEQSEMQGFIFGAGCFVRATSLAQKTHGFGAFNGLAVGLSLAAAVSQTLLGGPDNAWRRGEHMRLERPGEPVIDALQYLVLVSTLRRMPLGIKPFGAARPGLKMLRIDATHKHMLAALPALLGGAERNWLARAGFHREDPERIDLSFDGKFVLDGETFPGGDLSVRQGAPISFVIP